MKKSLSLALSCAIVFLSPGLGCWRALAAGVDVGVRVEGSSMREPIVMPGMNFAPSVGEVSGDTLGTDGIDSIGNTKINVEQSRILPSIDSHAKPAAAMQAAPLAKSVTAHFQRATRALGKKINTIKHLVSNTVNGSQQLFDGMFLQQNYAMAIPTGNRTKGRESSILHMAAMSQENSPKTGNSNQSAAQPPAPSDKTALLNTASTVRQDDPAVLRMRRDLNAYWGWARRDADAANKAMNIGVVAAITALTAYLFTPSTAHAAGLLTGIGHTAAIGGLIGGGAIVGIVAAIAIALLIVKFSPSSIGPMGAIVIPTAIFLGATVGSLSGLLIAGFHSTAHAAGFLTGLGHTAAIGGLIGGGAIVGIVVALAIALAIVKFSPSSIGPMGAIVVPTAVTLGAIVGALIGLVIAGFLF